jgi:hypothetical protein
MLDVMPLPTGVEIKHHFSRGVEDFATATHAPVAPTGICSE